MAASDNSAAVNAMTQGGVDPAVSCHAHSGTRKPVITSYSIHYTKLYDIMSLVHRLEQHRSLVQLVPMLEELHALLINHFAHEQFPGGLYESLGAYGSTHHDELRVLVNEHCIILSSVRGVLERARLANETQASEILNEVAAVINRITSYNVCYTKLLRLHRLYPRSLNELHVIL